MVLTEACGVLGRFGAMTFLNDLLTDFLIQDFHLGINFRRNTTVLRRRLTIHKGTTFCNYFVLLFWSPNDAAGKKNTLVNNQFFNKQGKVSYFIFREWMNELNKHQFIPWDWLCCSRGYSSIVSNLFNLEELNEKGLVLEWLAKSIRTQTTFLSVEFDYTRSLCN